MIDHELLWMLFLASSNHNTRNKNACIIAKSDKQTK